MLVEPVKINNLSYDNPYFIAKAEKVQDDGEEKKPWIKRNATALSCIAAVGIATAAILIAKGRARKFAIAGGKESYDFNQKLLKSKNLEDMLPDIDKMLSHNDDEVKFDTVRTLIDGKYINEDIAEKIISTLASLKPLKIWSQGSVDFHVHEVIKVMEDKNLLTPKFLDKLLDNAANYSPEYKMLIADNLAGIDRYKENPKIVGNQFKKLVNLLDNIEEKEYKGRFSNIGKPSMLQIDILSNHYKYTKLDTHKIKEIKEILNSNKYADDIKLNFIDAVSFSRTADNESVTAAELYKELFLGLQNNSAFKASKAFLHENKLDIADWLMLKMSLNPNKVLKPEEKLPVIQSLKKSALEEIKMNRFEYKDAYKFDKLLTEELKTKREVFADANPKYASIDDLEKFVDDMLETFRDAQKNRLDKDRYYNPLKSEFNSFEFDVVSKAGMETFMSERYKNLNKKIEDFGEMHFNKKYNKDEYRRSSSGRSEYKREDYQRSYDSFFTTKQTEAKNKILEVLNKDKNEKELLDLANELNSKKLDEALINKIRKKIAFKYHTDKAPQDKYNEYLQIMQEANNALDILKKTL